MTETQLLWKGLKKISDLGYKAEGKVWTDREVRDREWEIRDIKRRFFIALGFGMPLLYFSMGWMVGLPVPLIGSPSFQALIQLALTIPILIMAFKLYTSGIRGLLNRAPNMDSLVFLGTSSSFVYSMVVSIAIWLGIGNYGLKDLYYEIAAFILVFILLGKYLESVTKGKTSEALRKLMGLQAKTASVIRQGKEMSIPIDKVQLGDIVVVKP